jgi:ABC-2 type transport system ATP-binding protein
MHERITEIKSFLVHNDTSLAIRRMLDVMLDSGDKNLLQSAVSWSRKYRKQQTENNGHFPQEFYTEANDLLQKLEGTQNNFSVS